MVTHMRRVDPIDHFIFHAMTKLHCPGEMMYKRSVDDVTVNRHPSTLSCFVFGVGLSYMSLRQHSYRLGLQVDQMYFAGVA